MTSQVFEQSDNSLPNITSSAFEVQVSRIPHGFSVLIHCDTLTLFQKSLFMTRNEIRPDIDEIQANAVETALWKGNILKFAGGIGLKSKLKYWKVRKSILIGRLGDPSGRQEDLCCIRESWDTVESPGGTSLYGYLYITNSFVCPDIFSPKLARLIWTPVNTDDRHFSVSRVTNSDISSTPLYADTGYPRTI